MIGTNPVKIKLLVAAMILSSIAAFQLWTYFDCFYKGIAITFLFSGTLLHYILRKPYSVVWLLLTLNNAFDEFFGNPKTFGWNEMIFALLLGTYVIYTILRKKKCPKKPIL